MKKLIFILLTGISLYALAEQFQCEGKRTCKEMNSCEEAKFYLKQ